MTLTTAPHRGRRIREAREHEGLTQQQLAAAAGVSQATLSRIEVAGGGRAATLVAIASALDLSVEDLIAEVTA